MLSPNERPIRSFKPVADLRAEVLILGSMPGLASLAAGEYYAHPQNAFWRIMSDLLRFEASAPYAQRIKSLRSARIALWDVLQLCVRDGSLDSNIDPKTEIPNALPTFLKAHSNIRRVYFNGSKAESAFKRHVPLLLHVKSIHFARLPSTSPAHASLRFEQKLAHWRVILSPDTSLSQRAERDR